MPRALKPCGTYAAYRRHLAHGERVDAKCRKAARAAARTERNARTARKQTVSAEVVTLALANAPELVEVDELKDARENLRIVQVAMLNAPASAIASLSKRREELAQRVSRLGSASKPKENALDELARRRAERLAGTAN